MKAKVLEIKKNNVVLLLRSGKTTSVPKDKLKFEYSEGDSIVVSKKGGKFIFSPNKNKYKKLLWAIPVFIVIIAIEASILISRNLSQDENNDMTSSQQSEHRASNEPNDNNSFIKLQECLQAANKEYPSQEEINSSAENLELLKENLRKIVQSLNASITCYENADATKYSDKIAEIRSQKERDEALLNYDAPTSTYTYEPPTNDYPADHNYYAPDPSEYAPAPQPTCDDYNSKYYSEYATVKRETEQSYNSAITNTHNNICANRQGGCPQAGNLERERDYELARLKTQYKSNMRAVGCDPSAYVDF